HWKKALVFNGLGAFTTAMVLVVLTISKFRDGAWMVIILIPVLVIMFREIHVHYVETAKKLAIAANKPHERVHAFSHTAIVPISGIHPGVLDSINYALSISKDVRVCTVDVGEPTKRMQGEWKTLAPDLPLIVLQSPFRSVIRPVLDYIDKLSAEQRGEEKIT